MAKLLVIGPGPGPKNVLALLNDGSKVVIPYAIWKHKLSKEKQLAEFKEFKGAGGFVQFPVEERDVNGQTVRDVTIRALGSEGPYIRITVWPEFSHVDIEQGDLVFLDGPFEAREGQSKDGEKRVYLNMSTSGSLVVFKSEEKQERGTTRKSGGSKKSTDRPF